MPKPNLRLSLLQGDITNLKLYTNNANLTVANPSRRISNLCAEDFFERELNCRTKGYFCKSSIYPATSQVIRYIEKYDKWNGSKIINMNGYGICYVTDYVTVHFHEKFKTFTCSYDEDSFRSDYCHIHLNCLISMHEMAMQYERDVDDCRRQAAE